MNKLISIIVPCYNEQEVLPLFYENIQSTRNTLKEQNVDTELIFIDDGSLDNTINILKENYEKDNTLNYISFSRNFGKEAAILAGLKAAKGDYATIIDADLQHPPELIVDMYNELKSGEYDSVATYKDNRKKEGFFRRSFSKLFFKLLNKLTKLNIVEGATDFRLMNRIMINAIISLPESNRFSKGIFNWVGFKTKWIPFNLTERIAGDSKWSFKQLLRYSLDAIISFSEFPLKLCSYLGLIFCFVSFFSGLIHLIKTLIFGEEVAGFPTLYLMMLLLSGIVLLFLGVLGQYIARIYIEIKHRPLYIIREESNSK